MDHGAEARFKELMLKHAAPPIDPPPLDAAHAARPLERTANVPFFAHSYSFYRSMEHGFTPRDLLDFVYTQRANQLDLHFDYEQHEDLKAAEIAAILQRLGDRRMNALFDYSNSLNACEEPLAALRILAPFIRQVHVKGARKTIEGEGWGQIGVPQGCDEDELPGARMLHDLLMLGDSKPQVICFALEQEVDYYAPAFRLRNEPDDPVIRYREPSETPQDKSKSAERLIADERRWAVQQLTWNRALVATFRELAFQVVPDKRNRDWPALAGLPAANYAMKDAQRMA